METQMYDRIKEVLEANTKALATQIELNRELVSVKLEEVKKNTEEIKRHVEKMNGTVLHNTKAILLLEERQCEEVKRRKRGWAVSLAAITTMFGGIMVYIIHKFSTLR